MRNKKVLTMLLIIAGLVVACGVMIWIYLGNTIYSDLVPTVDAASGNGDFAAPDGIVSITEEEYNAGQQEDIDIDEPIGTPEPIYKTVPISDRIYNVLIIGDDARITEPRGRSDTQILCSFNRDTKEIKMVSFMRDILVPISDEKWNRINTAYMSGGAGKTINQLNRIFSLDIQRYVIVRFASVFALVDKIGGIDLTVDAAEAKYVNRIFPEYDQLSEGVCHLNGRQALAFARARKVGGSGDFERTRRQRDVIKAAFSKVRQTKDPSQLMALVQFATENIVTNIPLDEIFTLAMEILSDGGMDIGELRIPVDKSYTFAKYQNASILTISFKKNIEAIHELLYGTSKGVKIPNFGQPIFDSDLEPDETGDDQLPGASPGTEPLPGEPAPSPSPTPSPPTVFDLMNSPSPVPAAPAETAPAS